MSIPLLWSQGYSIKKSLHLCWGDERIYNMVAESIKFYIEK